ncbi:MAG: hypothetical protein ACI936_004249 [Paraglaciecola sp.]|jgi:hypothetical protein
MCEHKTEFEITITTKEKGVSDSFIREYSMDEHYNLLYIGEGRKYAANSYGSSDVTVQCNYLPDKDIEKALKKLLGLSTSVNLSSTVHNPLNSCFNEYQRCIINNTEILIKSVSVGYLYAIINKKWESELCQLPGSNSIAA